MRLLVITQDEPFYLAESIKYFLTNLPSEHEVVAAVLLDSSPHGKTKETKLRRLVDTYSVFGLKFTLFYLIRFIRRRLTSGSRVEKVFTTQGVDIKRETGDINGAESLTYIQSNKPDYIISIQANQIFKDPLLNAFPDKILNIHTSLLPRHRGLMPTFWVLKEGDKSTGVSVFIVDRGIDTGEIIMQKELQVGERSLNELIEYTKIVGMDCLLEAIDILAHNKKPVVVNAEVVDSYHGFPTREDVVQFLSEGNRLI